MDQSTFNHGKSGDTNPKGRSRSPLLELYTRSLRNEREEKIGHRTSAACGGRLRLCYTLDEGKESERETTNCPPKRVRSSARREVGSEGHEEKYRAVIEGAIPRMNRSAKGGTRSSPHYRGEGVLIHPPNQGVCGQHGTEEQRVTSGGLTRFAGGTAISGPISASEMESDAVSVVGLPE